MGFVCCDGMKLTVRCPLCFYVWLFTDCTIGYTVYGFHWITTLYLLSTKWQFRRCAHNAFFFVSFFVCDLILNSNKRKKKDVGSVWGRRVSLCVVTVVIFVFCFGLVVCPGECPCSLSVPVCVLIVMYIHLLTTH